MGAEIDQVPVRRSGSYQKKEIQIEHRSSKKDGIYDEHKTGKTRELHPSAAVFEGQQIAISVPYMILYHIRQTADLLIKELFAVLSNVENVWSEA